LSNVCSPLQLAPPLREVSSTGPAAYGAAPAAWQMRGLTVDGPGRQDTLKKS
jgi:hypothetical protein